MINVKVSLIMNGSSSNTDSWRNKRKAKTITMPRLDKRNCEVDHYMPDRSRADWITSIIGRTSPQLASGETSQASAPESIRYLSISNTVRYMDSDSTPHKAVRVSHHVPQKVTSVYLTS